MAWYDRVDHRVELTSIWKLLTNPTRLVTFPHTLFAAFLTAGSLPLSVSAWHLRRGQSSADPVHHKVAGLALGVMLVSAAGVALVGHFRAR